MLRQLHELQEQYAAYRTAAESQISQLENSLRELRSQYVALSNWSARTKEDYANWLQHYNVTRDALVDIRRVTQHYQQQQANVIEKYNSVTYPPSLDYKLMLPYAVLDTPDPMDPDSRYLFLMRAGFPNQIYPQQHGFEAKATPFAVAERLDLMYTDERPLYHLAYPEPNDEDKRLRRANPAGYGIVSYNKDTWWYWRYGRYLRDYVLAGQRVFPTFPPIPEPFRLPVL